MYSYKPHDQQSERAKHSMDRIIQKLLPASRLVISPLKIVIITMIIWVVPVWTSFTRVFYNLEYLICQILLNTIFYRYSEHPHIVITIPCFVIFQDSLLANKNQDASISAGILVSPRIPVLPSWGRWRIQGREPWMPLVVQEILSWLLLSQLIDRSHYT